MIAKNTDILSKIASIKSIGNPRKMIKSEFKDEIKEIDVIERNMGCDCL